MADTLMATPVTRAELEEVLADHPTRRDLAEYPTKRDLADALADYPTKRELRAELEQFATKQELRAELERFATKQELELWGGALLAHLRSMEQRLIDRMSGMEQRMSGMEQRMSGMEQGLLDELRRATTASAEASRAQIVALDDRYRDLPGRVTALETKVFAPKRRPR